MKYNPFQKIIVFIYLLAFVFFTIILVPFRDKLEDKSYKILHDVIWSQHSHIDLYRLIIYLFVTTVLFYFLFRYFEKYNSLTQKEYKIIIKKELRFLSYLVIAIIFVSLFFSANNGINKYREKRLHAEIKKNNELIYQYKEKPRTRKEFWDVCARTYDMSNYNREIKKYWAFLIRNKSRDEWLIYYLSNLSENEKESFKIETPQKFKKFIEKNSYTKKDIENFKSIKNLKAYINEDNNIIHYLKFYKIAEIQKIIVIIGLLYLLVLYMIRPIVKFLNSIYNAPIWMLSLLHYRKRLIKEPANNTEHVSQEQELKKEVKDDIGRKEIINEKNPKVIDAIKKIAKAIQLQTEAEAEEKGDEVIELTESELIQKVKDYIIEKGIKLDGKIIDKILAQENKEKKAE